MLAVLLSGLATSASKLGYSLGTDCASTHFASYYAWVDDTLWTGPRWRLLASANLPVPSVEPAVPAAWNRTCSARSLDTKLLFPLQLPFRTVEVFVHQFSVVPPSDFLLESFGCCIFLIFST